MPLCPQITNTPVTVTQTGDFVVTSVVPLIADTPDGLANNIQSIEILADGKTKVYRANDEPTGAEINNGDLWIDTNDGNKLYVRDSGVWVSAQDGAIGTAQTTANAAAAAAATAQANATTALANAATAYNAAIASLQPSANTIVNAQNQMTAINGNGITVYSGSSPTTGARVVLNSAGLAAFNSSNVATFSLTASTGAAVFSGSVTGATITASTLNIGGNAIIDATGLLTATGATITGTINATAGYFGTVSNGFSISATGLTGVGTGAITGGTIQTSSGSNAVILNGSSNAMQIKANGSVVTNMLNFSTSGALWHYGSTPDSSGATYPFVKLSSSNASIDASSTQYLAAGSNGNLVVGQTTYSGGTHTFSNTLVTNSTFDANSGITVAGAPVYTGDPTTTASTQTAGISLTQNGTITGRRSNNNPMNLHIFDVTAGTGTSVAVIQFIRNGTNRGTLEIFGNTTAPTLVGSSDYRLKENIRDYTGALDKLMATKVRVFNEIQDIEKNDTVGFVAHEFAEIFPDFVSGEKDAVDENGNPIYQKLGYGNLVPHLIRAIQELKTELNQLKGE
jgi:hypothetical protein